MALSSNNINPREFYTVVEVAKLLSLSDQTVRNILRAGKLSGKKIGRRWHIKGSSLIKYIES
ncbi:MAG: helix-turn-helix domain-containing protein [Proteobacteria bacterium]|nr:helix-turn-helix domain-containing protein [Pseudomonadota bacterium]